MQTLGYHGKMCLKYVITVNINKHVSEISYYLDDGKTYILSSKICKTVIAH